MLRMQLAWVTHVCKGIGMQWWHPLSKTHAHVHQLSRDMGIYHVIAIITHHGHISNSTAAVHVRSDQPRKLAFLYMLFNSRK